MKEVEAWVQQNIEILCNCSDEEKLLSSLWSVLVQKIGNKNFHKFKPLEYLNSVAAQWIKGYPYCKIYGEMERHDIRFIAGSQRRKPSLDHIIEICDAALAYEGTLIAGAVIEVITLLDLPNNKDALLQKLKQLQKMLKYGLPTQLDIILYELGFSDRIVAMSISSLLNMTNVSRKTVIDSIRYKYIPIRDLLTQYPSYFTRVLNEIELQIPA